MKVPKPEKLPSGSYRIRLRLGGESISITKPTEREAIRAAEKIKADYRNDIKTRPTGGAVKLFAAIDAYIADRENVLSPSTIRGYRTIQRTRFQSVMNKPLGKIDWQSVINAESRIASPKTINNAFMLIKSVYTENGLDVPLARLPALQPKEKPFLSPEDIQTFIAAAHGSPHEIGILLGLHGLRRSEIYGLEWEDIDLAANTIHIHQTAVMNEEQTVVKRANTKNASSTRTIPLMIPALREALEAVPDKTGAVVHAGINTIGEAVNRICKAEGLPLVGLHGLRHSFASLCYSLDINEMQCMRLGGWADYQTMRKIYTHLAASDNKKTDDKLVDFLKTPTKTPMKNE